MHTDGRGNSCEQKCHAKRTREENKIQEFMYRDTTNVEHDMYDLTSNKWSYQNSNRRFKEKFVSHTKTTFNRLKIKTAILGTSHIIRIVLQSET